MVYWFILHSKPRSITTKVSQEQKCSETVNWNYLRFSFPHREAHSSQTRLELRNIHFPIFVNIQLLKQLCESFRVVLLQTMRFGEHEFPYKLIHDEVRCIFFYRTGSKDCRELRKNSRCCLALEKTDTPLTSCPTVLDYISHAFISTIAWNSTLYQVQLFGLYWAEKEGLA